MKNFKLNTRAKTASGLVDALNKEPRRELHKRALCLAAYDMACYAYADAEAIGIVDTDIFETALLAMRESLAADAGSIFINILGGPHELSEVTRQHRGGVAMEAVARFGGFEWWLKHPGKSPDEYTSMIRFALQSAVHYALSASARYFDNVSYEWESDGGVGYNSAGSAEQYERMMALSHEDHDAANARMIILYKSAINKAMNSVVASYRTV